MIRIAIAIAFILVNFYIYYLLGTDEFIPERESFSHFPLEIEDWNCGGRETMDPVVLENLGATDYLMCNYVRGNFEEIINVYVGYHETQIRKGSKSNSIHPPEHCLLPTRVVRRGDTEPLKKPQIVHRLLGVIRGCN